MEQCKEKTKNSYLIKRIVSYLKPHKKSLLLICLILFISTIIGFLQPLVIRTITDDGMMQKNMEIIWKSAIILALLILINQGAELLQTRIFANIHNTSYLSIFQNTFHKLLHMKKSYFSDKNNAEILGFLQMDVSQVSSVTDRYIILSISYVFRIISGLFGLFIIDWKLALIVLAMVPLKFLIVRTLSKRQEKAIDEMIETNRDFSQWFGDNINGIDEIKLWGLFQNRNKTFQEKQLAILKLEKSITMIDASNSFFEVLLEWGVSILLYLLGGFFICTGHLTIGAVFAFVSYSSYVTGPVSTLINLKMYFSRVIPSARRLFAFLDTETEQDNGDIAVKDGIPTLEFKNVSFSYNNNRKILDNVNFVVKPGEKIAIIGKNGSGKSTILNLLLRFYEPTDGKIFANNMSIESFKLEDYRSLFAVVSQDPYLFLGNVIDNINLTGKASKEKCKRSIKTSGAEMFISKLPEKDNSQIGHNGAKLSGGEKQKLAVARALLKDAPIMILDEATSGFDVESDVYLHDVILKEMKEKSVIMITHHYKFLNGMDRVYKIENGSLLQITM